MILVSCRLQFDSNQRFAASNEIRNYPNLPDIGQFEPLSAGELAAEMRGKHVLVLVHGFRNPLDKVAGAYRQLEDGLRQHGLLGTPAGYDAVVGYLWPGFATPAGFFPAVPWANRSAGFFRQLLQALETTAHTVDVQTHSLGARVALQALAFEPELFVDNLLLTAPAVDNESLEPRREFNGSLRSCRRCLVYHSTNDRVLRLDYRIGALDKALGDQGPQNPELIRTQCPDVFVVDCSKPIDSHGGYRKSTRVFGHWRRVLSDEALDRFEALDAENAVAAAIASGEAAGT